MIRIVLALACAACLAGCNTTFAPNVTFGGPGLVSGNSPAAPLTAHGEPQSPNSLPPGAEGLQSGPQSRAPDYASATIKLP